MTWAEISMKGCTYLHMLHQRAPITVKYRDKILVLCTTLHTGDELIFKDDYGTPPRATFIDEYLEDQGLDHIANFNIKF
ncbi:hypothetical protein TNCV_1862591 [Trichonephila clavipes]|nr:hypothetical protein TNCV_1862591 [Trichonephila clavipes]